MLEGLDPVRKRPGMYIGSTGQRGLHHLVSPACCMRWPWVHQAWRFRSRKRCRLTCIAGRQVYEILDNAIDEVQGGHAKNVKVAPATGPPPGLNTHGAWPTAL